MVVPLNRTNEGEQSKVVWIASDSQMAHRLINLGFLPDTEVICMIKGHHGGMMAYLIKNSMVALRSDTAAEIFVRTKD